MRTLFEKSRGGNNAAALPGLDVPVFHLPPDVLREEASALPQLSEPEVVQHYTELSRRNFGVDNGFYPLGSCTMKYNPKINEECASLAGLCDLHPLVEGRLAQGALRVLYNLEQYLCALTDFNRFSLQPLAGAQAEFTALLMAKAYFRMRGEEHRNKVLIPDVAHGTNPASCKLAGYKTREIKTTNGAIDLSSLKSELDGTVACIMITNPNTLGIFERDIVEINRLVHEAGGLSYLDGANFNALIGRYPPAEQGFDIAHFNLHKTFSTPHGGGGPGAGALGIADFLDPFLPLPVVEKRGVRYVLNFNRPFSIGKLSAFWGNFLVLVRAYAYLMSIGNEAHKISEAAVANAYYLRERLCPPYDLAYDVPFLHEFVISCERIRKDAGVRAFDLCKRLMDFGFHPPTMYFPITVKEALMIEPTETVSKDILDEFIAAMLTIHKECYENHDAVKSAPRHTNVSRVDETKAARQKKLRS